MLEFTTIEIITCLEYKNKNHHAQKSIKFCINETNLKKMDFLRWKKKNNSKNNSEEEKGGVKKPRKWYIVRDMVINENDVINAALSEIQSPYGIHLNILQFHMLLQINCIIQIY